MYSNNIKPGRNLSNPAYQVIPNSTQYQAPNNIIHDVVDAQRPGSIARTQHQYHHKSRPSEVMPLQQIRKPRAAQSQDGHYSSLQLAFAHSYGHQHETPAESLLKKDLLNVHKRHSIQQETKPAYGRSSLQNTKSRSLAKDLQDIHRRNSMHGAANHRKKKHSVYEQVDTREHHATKKSYSKKTSVYPLHKQDEQLYEKLPINTLASIADQNAGLDLGSYTKDYVRLSMEYKRTEKYRRGYKHRLPACIKCSRQSRHVGKVFFPCEHRCVCDSCLAKQLPKKCALCNQAIRIILDHTGKEQEQYWKWVEEVKPSISNAFLKSFFVQSKDAIRLAMADMNMDYASSIGSLGHRSHANEEQDAEDENQEIPTILTMIHMACRKLFFFRRRTSRVQIQEANAP